MSNELFSALAGVAERLIVLAETDEGLRSRLQALAKAVLTATEMPVRMPDPTPLPATDDAEATVARSLLSASAAGTPARTPKIGMAGPERVPVPWVIGLGAAPARPVEQVAASEPASATPATQRQEVTDADLPIIEDRLRLKGEGARWAATRRRRLAEGADFRMEIEPLDRDIIEKGKELRDCFLWMNHPAGPSPSDLSLLDDLAGCFDNAADAVALVRGILNDSTPDQAALEQALGLMAEAQSALRAAVVQVGYGQDKDQVQAYHWLRTTCWKLQYFIDRYMKIEDTADPSSWPDRDRRIEASNARVQQDRERAREYQSSLKRIRYHLKRIAETPDDDRLHDWKTVVETAEKMVQEGVPPSNTDLRELLLPVIDKLPDLQSPPGFALVLREIDRFAATRPAGKDEPAASEPTAEVRAVADMLRDRTVVLIGGVRRSDAHKALKEAFGLKDLDWVETREHESFTTFEPHVARPDVALVILAIRWSSHAFGDVKAYCDRYDKPLVRLPAGYNPNQVAMQVLAQCSGQLSNR